MINWKTASEINSDYFEIQRSVDGLNFQSIGKVKANGNSSELKKYQFIDENPFSQNNYYRLKIVDFNGSFEFSKVNHIKTLGIQNSSLIEVFPNPVKDYLKIETNNSNLVKVEFFNSNGIRILKSFIQKEKSFNLENWKTGVYYWKITHKETVLKNGKLIKL